MLGKIHGLELARLKTKWQWLYTFPTQSICSQNCCFVAFAEAFIATWSCADGYMSKWLHVIPEDIEPHTPHQLSFCSFILPTPTGMSKITDKVPELFGQVVQVFDTFDRSPTLTPSINRAHAWNDFLTTANNDVSVFQCRDLLPPWSSGKTFPHGAVSSQRLSKLRISWAFGVAQQGHRAMYAEIASCSLRKMQESQLLGNCIQGESWPVLGTCGVLPFLSAKRDHNKIGPYVSCLRSQQPCRFAKQDPSCFMFLPSTSYMFAGLDTSMLGKHCSGFCFLEKSFRLYQVSRYPFGHRTNQHSLKSLRSFQKGTLSADVFFFPFFPHPYLVLAHVSALRLDRRSQIQISLQRFPSARGCWSLTLLILMSPTSAGHKHVPIKWIMSLFSKVIARWKTLVKVTGSQKGDHGHSITGRFQKISWRE